MILILLSVAVLASAQNLTVLHLNDTHSHIDPERNGMGGVIEQAAYIDSVRLADGPENVMLLHAGDFSQGTSYFTELKGDLEIDVLNAMAFDAVCLGNHEFDNGIDELVRRLKNLDTPVVCANYDFSGSELSELVKPYVIIEKAGKKIGIIGLLTDLSSVVDGDIARAMKYSSPSETADRYAEMLRYDEGCDLVVCLTHLGFEDEPYTDVELAKATRHVDLIVGGHSHTKLEDLRQVRNLDGEKVTVVTDGKWGLEVGNLSVVFKDRILTDKYREVRSRNVFVTDGSWFPYPEYSDREGWNRLLGDYASYYIKAGERYLQYEWKNVPATAYLAYERTGERRVMEDPLSANSIALNSLLMAELAEGKGRFVDQLVNGLWNMCHMPSWVLSAHLPRQASRRSLPDPREQLIDLFSAGAGAQVSVAYHFFKETFDKIDPVITYVMKDAVKRQVLDPYLNQNEYKANWWLGFVRRKDGLLNNWTPWCNADVMLCFLLMEDDPQRLDQAIRQSARSVDLFVDYIKKDGACEEGPAYWGHAAGKLYDYLQLMYDASSGAFSLFDHQLVKDMGEYISRSYVKDNWVVNFADASAKLYFSPSLIYNYGKAVGSEEMMEFAIYNLADTKSASFASPKPSISKDIYRILESMRHIVEMKDKTDQLNSSIKEGQTLQTCMQSLRTHVPSYVWYPETQFYYLRNGDWFFASKGGHNNESHNHNDVGTFLLYIDGVPMFVDAGVGTYTKKTFSEDRYSIWSMQSDWHNLPMINGTSQVVGREHKATDVAATPKSFSLDMVEAYFDAAACKSWKRTYRIAEGTLSVSDVYELSKRVAADVENFLVQGEVALPGESLSDGTVAKPGEVLVMNSGKKVKVVYPKSMTPSVSVQEMSDPRLTNVWGTSLRRISFTGNSDAPLKGKYQFTITELK